MATIFALHPIVGLVAESLEIRNIGRYIVLRYAEAVFHL